MSRSKSQRLRVDMMPRRVVRSARILVAQECSSFAHSDMPSAPTSFREAFEG
jgi:hypothetical protein